MATFIDRFGLPWITVTTNRTDKKNQDIIENKTKLIGQGATAVLPTGTMIDLKQPQNTDAFNVFKAMIDSCDQNISKQIVGGTMLSDDGSSQSQSEVHERNLTERISLADMRSFQFFVNDQLIPLLNTHGFKLNPTFAFDTTKEVELKDLFTIVQGLSTNYEINQEWISKTFNIPIDGKKELPSLSLATNATAQLDKKKSLLM